MYIKTCVQCGETFTTDEKKQRFCSRKCVSTMRRKRIVVRCETCGKVFISPQTGRTKRNGSTKPNGPRRFCSNACRYKAMECQTERTCEICGNVFSVNPVEVKRGGGKYCSRACFFESRRRLAKHPARRTNNGYVVVYAPEHPRAGKDGYILEHILVWENANGPVPDGFEIHHVDGNKTNNALENLTILPKAEHSSLHVTHYRYTRDELVQNLQAVAEQLGGRISHKEFMVLSPISPTPYYREFGGLKQAIKEVLGESCHRKVSPGKVIYTEEQLADNLKELHRQLGRIPRLRDMNTTSPISFRPYVRLWGSWKKARVAILGE